MKSKILFEACVETVDQAVSAEEGGADRIELCSRLDVGGVTPDFESIRETRNRLKIPVHVLVRPRAGDFCYSPKEFEEMLNDTGRMKEIGIDGVVLGVLNSDRSVDMRRTAALVGAARPMSITFHRAFDETPEPIRALEDIISLGIERLLTSGQKPAAKEGIDLIKDLVIVGDGRVCVMAGGGVSEKNVLEIIRRTGVREVHGSLRGGHEDPHPGEYALKVRQFVGILP
jgi:copper homeostasis protein